jgi:hypothetical protein
MTRHAAQSAHCSRNLLCGGWLDHAVSESTNQRDRDDLELRFAARQLDGDA